MGKWNTSLKELLTNFRGALISIIPWLERTTIGDIPVNILKIWGLE